jgi:hypothetical protein
VKPRGCPQSPLHLFVGLPFPDPSRSLLGVPGKWPLVTGTLCSWTISQIREYSCCPGSGASTSHSTNIRNPALSHPPQPQSIGPQDVGPPGLLSFLSSLGRPVAKDLCYGLCLRCYVSDNIKLSPKDPEPHHFTAHFTAQETKATWEAAMASRLWHYSRQDKDSPWTPSGLSTAWGQVYSAHH